MILEKRQKEEKKSTEYASIRNEKSEDVAPKTRKKRTEYARKSREKNPNNNRIQNKTKKLEKIRKYKEYRIPGNKQDNTHPLTEFPS